MKKFLFGLLVLFGGTLGFIFAQNILPDSAEILIKSPITQGEAANMTITMMKDGSKMSTYDGEIGMRITTEEGRIMNRNEYVLPNSAMYQFLPEDLGSKVFQKGLEIKKVGKFYVEVYDYNDEDDKVLGRQLVEVVRGRNGVGEYHIEVLEPTSDTILVDENLKIIATVKELPNSNISIYLDDNLVGETASDGNGNITKGITNVDEGNHVLRLDCHDIEGNILGSSDDISFVYMPRTAEWYKDVKVTPEDDLKVGDVVKVVVTTDEMVETVKVKLSDRGEDTVLLEKEGNGLFSQRIFLVAPGEVSISLIMTSDNNSKSKTYQDVKRIYVGGAPEIGEVKTDIDEENRSAKISWTVVNGATSGYIVNYRVDGISDFSGEKWTENEFFTFDNVPYDREIFMNITPYWNGQKNHGAASKTVQFVISKPRVSSGQGASLLEISPNMPKCTVQNISLRTTKIGDSYYLMWDKIENVSKYMVYSSVDESGKNRTKVYETSDTSYEYPFDHTSEKDQFLYFWIVGVCEDGEELELSGATKVQVGPAENFFLLLCLTLMIYFGIKLFRETEV